MRTSPLLMLFVAGWASLGWALDQVTSKAYEVGDCLPSWPTGGARVRAFLDGYGISLGPTDSIISSVSSRSVVVTTTMENHSKIDALLEASTSIGVLNGHIQKHLEIKHTPSTNEAEIREFLLINPGLALLKRREQLSAEMVRVKKEASSAALLPSLQEQLDRTNAALAKAIEL